MAKKGSGSTATEATLLHLDPSEILAEDNARYGMRENGIEALKSSVLASGGVMEPVEIDILEPATNGHKYKLTFGFKRHAVVSQLNKEGAGLKLPCILHKNETPIERTKRQVEENLQRESLSIMDQAVAMKRLMDSGLSRAEVREVFRRPGGRKGNKTQPISNSYLNMLVSFLEFPKKIRDRIHNDEIGVAAAYELRKAAPDKWEQILDRIEADTVKLAETEEKEETRYLADQKKAEEAQQKHATAATELEIAQKKVAEAQELVKARTEAANKYYAATKVQTLDTAQRKAAEKDFGTAEQARRVAVAQEAEAQVEVNSLKAKATKAAELAKERLDRLVKARAAKKSVSPQDVKKSAAEVTGSGAVPLNRAEIMKVVEVMCLPGTVQGVAEIGKVLRDCFVGIITDGQCFKKLAEIVS